jgi:hypothetical protein
MKIQMAVVTLAEELNYARASEKLNIIRPELWSARSFVPLEELV